MTSTASQIIIDWIVAIPVVEKPQPAAQPATAPAPQLPAPNHERLYRADVLARARELYAPPHYLTTDERIAISAQLDAEREQRIANYFRKYGHVNERDNDCGYGPVSLCAPGRGDTLTGRR